MPTDDLFVELLAQMEARLRSDIADVKSDVKHLQECASQNNLKLDKLWADAQVEDEGREILNLAMKYPKLALLVLFIMMQAASVLFTGFTVRSDVSHMLKEFADGNVSP